MYFKILKKDIKRKKSMTIILLIFVILATMFFAGGLNNMLVVTSGLDDYMEEANVGDYIIISVGGTEKNEKKIREFIENEECVDKYGVTPCYVMTRNRFLKEDGSQIKIVNTTLLECLGNDTQIFFDGDNEKIAKVNDGEIYITKSVLEENKVNIGDKIYIEYKDGIKKEFTVTGYVKDAALGSDMMGIKRIIISDNDYAQIDEDNELLSGNFYCIWGDEEAFGRDYNKQDFKVAFAGDRALLKSTYLMDMILAAVVLAVSVCLVIISIVMLRFTILFTINEDYREIGIMKAIGIKNTDIRKLYIVKYFVISVVGAVIGCIASFPFNSILVQSVVENMVVESKVNVPLMIAVSVVVVFLVVMFAYISTGKIKTFTPMDAIRNGNAGERFKKKGVFKLKKSHMKTTSFLACNDVFSEIKRYIVLVITTIIGIWLLAMFVNTINTLCSDKIIPWFGTTSSDMYINDSDNISSLLAEGNKESWYQYLNETKEKVEQAGYEVERINLEVMFRFTATKDDRSYNSLSFQGLNNPVENYKYDKGTPPKYENEVAVTYLVAEKLGADIGDTIYINTEEEEKPYIITALYQSMNNMGEGIRFNEKEEIEYSGAIGSFGVQITFKEDYSKAELKEIAGKLTTTLGATAQMQEDYVSDMLGGIAQRLADMKQLILAIIVIINILVVVLMQKMFLIRERGEMAMLKSIGFTNRAIITWQTKRIALVLFVGTVFGTLTGTIFTQITSGQVFKIMGATKIAFQINPLEVYLIYPLELFAITVIACIIVMFKVRKITVQDVNDAE